MFTGIIEAKGVIKTIAAKGTNKTFWIESPITNELKVDQSVSHNGACLTVEEIKETAYRVTAIEETLLKTNMDNWQAGWEVNLERSLSLGVRLDGHIVQGHVDTVATCISIAAKNGSKEFSFSFDEKFASLVIEKGSIAVDGVSLTIFNVGKNNFTVAIIPYTLEHTNIKHLQVGNKVNIEFDMIGKYVNRIAQQKQ
ncbi:riboflavin synthase [Ferruginibacter albus]|uniref:riboflavin synthase n=1 Tax=Ferruginibacter albus TaxID=2875540 RepID=UPI001CC6E471|nr:riboflavin synthase [Ferruginibacter albus]UAY53517.1 riboflavin synthase [Ferruginibacter albus]